LLSQVACSIALVEKTLILGPPGSGKTTKLRERFASLIADGAGPESVALFVLTRRASRAARADLARRIARSVPALNVFTPHSFAYGIVEPANVLSAPEQLGAVREMLAAEKPKTWPFFADVLSTTVFARALADFMVRAQERSLGPDDLDALVASAGRPEYEEVARFYREYLRVNDLADRVDFGGLLAQAASKLSEDDQPRFAHVLVDDYQDVPIAFEAVLMALSTHSASLTVAADPEGAVFSYRGGGGEALERIDDVLGPIARLELNVSHRPAPAEARRYAHPGEEAEAVAHELIRTRVEDDVGWGDMAVILRRYGTYITALRHALRRHRIPHVVVGEGAAVAREPAVAPVLDLMRYALRPQTRADLLEPLLLSPIVGLDPHELRALRRDARMRELSLLSYVEEASDVEPRVEAFRALVAELPDLARRERPDSAFFELWTRLAHFRGMVEGEDERSLDAIAEFADVLARFSERRPEATIEDYLEAVEAAAFGPDPWMLPEERHPDAVRITTAHLAHGAEFETALVAGCIEGEFPALSASEPIVSLDALLAPGLTGGERTRRRLHEERALFRLAASRARQRTVLFSSRSTGARNPRTPSRFAASLFGLEWTNESEPAHPIPISARGLEASLRQRLADAGAPKPARLAALGALAHLDARPREWWGANDWTPNATPLHPEGIRTSYSRLDPMENCGLQYLFATELGLDRERSYQMWLGSVIHHIVDRAQRKEIEHTEEALKAALDEIWNPDIFPNRAIEHRRYLDACDMLSRWLNFEHGEPVASEVRFEFPFDGATITGRIDAVFPMTKRHNLRIMDYKTGRWVITKEEAREDLQLGIYYLACKLDEELKKLGQPVFLQLGYLGAPRRDGFGRAEVFPSKVENYEAKVEAKVRSLLARIRAEDFAPSPDADCMFCSFKPICPMWPEGKEALAK
jgi:superfamily I DNA/RNA helicase